MFKWSTISGVGVTALFAASSPALADLSGADVWELWKDQMDRFGYTVSAQENSSGSVLTVSGVVFDQAFPDDAGSVRSELEAITFEDQSDGSVRISFPASMVTIVDTDFEGETTDAVIDVTFDQFAMIATGQPGDVIYDYSANALGIVLSQLMINGESDPSTEFALNLAGIAGKSEISGESTVIVNQNFAAESMTLKSAGTDPEEGGSAVIDMTAQSLAFRGNGTIPEAADMENPRSALRAGFAMDGGFEVGPMTIKAVAEDDESGIVNVDATSQAASASLKLGTSGLEYGGNYEGVDFTVISAETPFPIMAGLASYGFDLAIPLMRSDVPQDFALNLKLDGLTLSDAIWGMFDPGAMLSREPAVISLATKGTLTLFDDLMPEDSMSAATISQNASPTLGDEDEEIPAEINSLDINEVVVRLLGANVEGQGGFTFDNTDVVTFDGMPRPTGKLDFTLSGVNTLMETLVQMGLLPAAQAAFASSILQGFTTQIGDDEATTTLEINESGHVLANGMRLQ